MYLIKRIFISSFSHSKCAHLMYSLGSTEQVKCVHMLKCERNVNIYQYSSMIFEPDSLCMFRPFLQLFGLYSFLMLVGGSGPSIRGGNLIAAIFCFQLSIIIARVNVPRAPRCSVFQSQAAAQDTAALLSWRCPNPAEKQDFFIRDKDDIAIN